jgi:L-fuconolactonase
MTTFVAGHQESKAPPIGTRPNRRDFLQTTVAGVAVATLGGARVATAAEITKARPSPRAATIIDTHTHFYDPARPQGVPWPDKSDKLLYRAVLPKDYRALPKPQKVTGTVVIEASPWLEDNQWILDLAAADPFIVGCVGNLPVGAEAFRAHLKRFAANRLFRGLRIGEERLSKGLNQAGWLDDLKLLAAKDLCLDLLGGPDILPGVARLARAIPDLRLVIDHVANVKIDGQRPPAGWQGGLIEAAQGKNVYCKVSGLVEGTGRANGTAPGDVEFYKPVLDAVWNAFGEDRLLYGSNWPVSERFAPCATVQQIVTDYFRPRGQAALEKVFWKNAQAVYK